MAATKKSQARTSISKMRTLTREVKKLNGRIHSSSAKTAPGKSRKS